MNNTQSIIVYRNPMEQAFWERASGAEAIPIIASVVIFTAVFILLQKLVDRFVGWRWNTQRRWQYLCLLGAALAAIVTANLLWI